MANQIIIDIGAVANDGTGDPLRTAFNYVNNNFSNIWATGVANSNISFSGNKILTTNTNGNLVLAPNGVGKVQANVDIVPNANNTLSLGSLTRQWNTVYARNLEVAGDTTFNNLTVNGNLTVQGNTIQIGNIVTDTKTIQLANTASTANAANGSGITVGANDNIATMLYNSSSNVWTTNIGITATGNIAGNYFIGNGSLLTGIASPYGNSNVAAYLPTYTGNLSGGNLSISSAGNTWTILDQFLTGPGGAYWHSHPEQGTDDFVGAPGANLRIQSINVSNVVESQVELTGTNIVFTVDNGVSRAWRFNESGVTEFPLDITPVVAGGANANIGNVTNPWANAYITGNIIAGNIIPVANNTQSLGNATNQWSDLYVSNATIYMNNVPISLTAGNVLTVNGADVVTTAANGESSIGNLNILGTVIEIAAGAPETQINISPELEGWAYLQLPTNATANSANTRLHNDAGNVEIGTGDFSTGVSSYEWIFTNTGNLAIPGTIVSDSTVRIDNRESGITADIQLYAADDILLQAGDRTLGDDAEGGDINIYAGDGAPDDAGSGNTGGGDIQIIGGRGGAAGNAVSGDNGGSVRLDAGQGGDGSANAAGGNGATAYLSAGSGGIDNGGGGGDGGDVVITAGDTTDVAQDRGSVILNAGGGGDETSLGGYVQVSIPSVGANPGGQWTFTGSGTTLETPPNAEIFGPNFGNLTVGSAGNTIITSADYGFTTYNWVFDNAGGIVAPNLTVTRGDRTGTLTGSTLRIGNGSQEAILTTPNGVEGSDSQRLVINPGAGSEFGEGGDIYLYSGRGGASGGSGGDIKIRGGLGPADGAGGYIDIVGGEAAGNGVAGYIDIQGGQSAGSTGGYVRIEGGQGTTGGDANITGGVSTAGPGGGVNITGGTSSNGLAEYGNVTVTAGASTWTFNNTGNLIVPGEGVIRSIDDTIQLQSYDTPNSIARGLRVGTNGGLFLEIGNNQPWLAFTNDSGDAEIGAAPGVAGTGNAGYNLTLFGGPADTSVYGTGAGGNIDLRAGLGAGNDGGGGGPGGWVNIIAGNSYDPAGVSGNVAITSGSNTWTFDNTGSFVFPGAGVTMDGQNNSLLTSGLANVTIGTFVQGADGGVSWEYQGDGSGNSSYGAVGLDTAGTANTANLQFKVQLVSDQGNVSTNKEWIFDTAGTLTAPGNISAGNFVGGGTNVDIVAGSYNWTFDNTGNLTLPGNTFAVNYANGTAVSLGGAGSYGNANVATFLAAYGSNTISTTGNITGGNIIATANVLANGYARLTGTFDESQASTAGLYLGYAGGTPRIMFGTGNTNQTLQIDNDGGTLRFYKPGTTLASLTNTGNFSVTGNISGNVLGYAIGYRDIPQVTFSANATAALTDAGKHYYSTTAGNLALTLPDNANVAYPLGATLTVVVNAAGNVLVNQDTGVSLYMAGSSSTGNRVVGAYGLASVMKVATNTWVISGTGVY